MKYSIIDGNSAETRICVALNDIAKYNNIIFTNNTSTKPDKYPGMLYSYGCHLYIENCFIAKNNQNGQYLFGTHINSGSWGLLFPGSITVSNSYIDTTENLYKSGQKVNIGPNKDVSIELHLHSTDLCPGAKSIVYIHTENKITDPIHIEFSRFFYLSSLIFFSKLKN